MSSSDATTKAETSTERIAQSARDDLHSYLALVLTSGVGPITLRSLLDYFETPQAVLRLRPTNSAKSKAWALRWRVVCGPPKALNWRTK